MSHHVTNCHKLPCSLTKMGKTLVSALFASAMATPVLGDDLMDIYQLALKNDPQLQIAQAQFNIDKEEEVQKRGELLPQVGLEYAINSQKNKTNLGSSDTRSHGFGLSVTQTVFDATKWYSFKSSQSLTAQATASFENNQQELMVRTAEAYFNVLKAKDVLASSVAEEKAIERQLEQTQQRYDVGLIAITDVNEATANYDLTRVQRLSNEGRLGIAYEALSVLTGQSHNELSTLKQEFPTEKPDSEVATWLDLALTNNKSLKQSELASQSALLVAKATKSSILPKISASASYNDRQLGGDLQSDLNGRNIDENATTSFGVSLTMPLYTSGIYSSKTRQAYEQYNQALEQITLQRRSITQAIRSLYLTVSTDAAQVSAQQKALISTQSALKATEAGYQVGTRNVVDVLNAQRNVFAARRNLAIARYDFVINSMKLKQQAGTLSPEDIMSLNQWLVSAK